MGSNNTSNKFTEDRKRALYHNWLIISRIWRIYLMRDDKGKPIGETRLTNFKHKYNGKDYSIYTFWGIQAKHLTSILSYDFDKIDNFDKNEFKKNFSNNPWLDYLTGDKIFPMEDEEIEKEIDYGLNSYLKDKQGHGKTYLPKYNTLDTLLKKAVKKYPYHFIHNIISYTKYRKISSDYLVLVDNVVSYLQGLTHKNLLKLLTSDKEKFKNLCMLLKNKINTLNEVEIYKRIHDSLK